MLGVILEWSTRPNTLSTPLKKTLLKKDNIKRLSHGAAPTQAILQRKIKWQLMQTISPQNDSANTLGKKTPLFLQFFLGMMMLCWKFLSDPSEKLGKQPFPTSVFLRLSSCGGLLDLYFKNLQEFRTAIF